MPNKRNIEAPINLHGLGRSGTTLLQNLIGESPDIQTCNETAGLIYCAWRAGEAALLSSDTSRALVAEVLPRHLVHLSLMSSMPSRKPRWSQKIGGLPNQVAWNNITTDDRDYARGPFPFPYSWYWRVVREAFPSSYDVLILRNYKDVIVSRALFSRWDAQSMAETVAVYFNLLAHPAAKIDHCIFFDDLVAEPERTSTFLFEKLGVAMPSTAARAFDEYCVSSGARSLAGGRQHGFSWSDRYGDYITPEIERVVAPALLRLEERFPRS